MRKLQPLSASFVARAGPGRYGDGGRGGHGLSLLVKTRINGRLAKSWSQRVRLPGHSRYTNLGLGLWPVVTLARARQVCIENLQAIHDGRDPREPGIPTFADAVEEVIKLHSPTWRGAKTENDWRASMTNFASPVARLPVNLIKTPQLLNIIAPIWHKKPEIARRVRQRIAAVMKWAAAMGYLKANPADALDALLPAANGNGVRTVHHKALDWRKVPAALRTISDSEAWWGARLGLLFLAHTATRSGEIRMSRWGELSLSGKLWTCPAERTKSGRPLRVPLSEPALRLLMLAREHAPHGPDRLVFPARRGWGKVPMRDLAFSRLMASLKIAGVPHGFRSSFRDWAAEHGVNHATAEACLAHQNPDKTVSAYMRSDLLDARRPVMASWSAFLDGGKEKA